MGVYKTRSVYKTSGVYRSEVYKEPSESVLFNGVRYENSFYEIDSQNVGSTFVDSIQLPSGYEKLGRVWNGNTNYDGPPTLISTTYQIPELFGDVYLGFWSVSQTINYARVFGNIYIDENHRYTRVQNNNIITSYIWNVNANGPGTCASPRTASCQLNDTNKLKMSLLSNGTWRNGREQEGTFAEDRHIEMISGKALTYFRFAFVADRNRLVTFTAIPCKHGSDYGLYDIVAGKFYTHPDLTGD